MVIVRCCIVKPNEISLRITGAWQGTPRALAVQITESCQLKAVRHGESFHHSLPDPIGSGFGFFPDFRKFGAVIRFPKITHHRVAIAGHGAGNTHT